MFLDSSKAWAEFFKRHYSKSFANNLLSSVYEKYATETCYPAKELIFESFRLCGYENLKVVIIGQDPYHGPGQAQGLAFSVPSGFPHPPSLKNILIELSKDQKLPYPINGSLESWAQQGVLLLNGALSVEKSKPGSHLKLWNPFTKTLIKALSNDQKKLVFVLWGGFAQKYKPFIDATKHEILETGHPSPLSANRGYWFGNGHFSKINSILKKNHKDTINWTL